MLNLYFISEVLFYIYIITLSYFYDVCIHMIILTCIISYFIIINSTNVINKSNWLGHVKFGQRQCCHKNGRSINDLKSFNDLKKHNDLEQ